MQRTDVVNHMPINYRHIPLTFRFWCNLGWVYHTCGEAERKTFHCLQEGDKKQLEQNNEHLVILWKQKNLLICRSLQHPYLLGSCTDPKEENMCFRSGFKKRYDLKNKSVVY